MRTRRPSDSDLDRSHDLDRALDRDESREPAFPRSGAFRNALDQTGRLIFDCRVAEIFTVIEPEAPWSPYAASIGGGS